MRRKVKVKVCDRCPIGKELAATREMTFSLEGSTWKIELCEKHGNDLDRAIGGWGRLGEQVEPDSPRHVFTPEYGAELRRVAELRSRQADEDRARRANKDQAAKDWQAIDRVNPVITTAARPQVLQTRPTSGRPWIFTDHARERMEQRGVDILDALHAATVPTLVRSAKTPELRVHERGDVRVVVNPEDCTIITVLDRSIPDN